MLLETIQDTLGDFSQFERALEARYNFDINFFHTNQLSELRFCKNHQRVNIIMSCMCMSP